MNRSVLQGYFRIGIFVGVGGVLLMFAQPPDSAEFVISACSGVIGLLLVIASGALMWSQRDDN